MNERSSNDVHKFNPVDKIIFEYLPTNESVLNYYFFEKQRGQLKNDIAKDIASELSQIWKDFVEENNLIISVLSDRQIKNVILSLIDSWQEIQKHVNRINQKNKTLENKFVDNLKCILNCAKGSDKEYFANEDLDISDLPRGKIEYFPFLNCIIAMLVKFFIRKTSIMQQSTRVQFFPFASSQL